MHAHTHMHTHHRSQLQEKKHVLKSPTLLELSRPKEATTDDGAPSGNGPRDSDGCEGQMGGQPQGHPS